MPKQIHSVKFHNTLQTYLLIYYRRVNMTTINMATLSDIQSYEPKEKKTIVVDQEEVTRSPSEVSLELIAPPKQSKRSNRSKRSDTIVRVNTKFCTHVGLEGILVLLFMLVIAGLFGYVTYQYTSYFSNFNREFVWLFMLIGLIYFLAVLWFTKRWKKIADDYTKRATGRNRKTSGRNPLLKWYSKAFINGPFFLWKLYITEFFESINQLINFFTVYLCSLPVGWSVGFGIALGIDSWLRGYGVLQKNTPIRRDRQIKIDILVDFLCAGLPLSVMWFGYKVPISVADMIQIAFFPAFCLWTKLRSIFREIIRVKSVQAVLKDEDRIAKNLKRHRKSIYSVDETIKIAKKQQNIIPYKVRIGFVVYNVLYGLFLCSTAIIHLVSQSITTCEPLLWNSCVVKTPFCGAPFRPTCNCVVLNVRKHNWTTLPDEIHEMNALKVMQINHGPLEVIPDGFDKNFSKVSVLDLSYNELTKVPESLGNMGINKLTLDNNKLNELPDSVWGNKFTNSLELDNNNIGVIYQSIISSTSLTRLYMSNNSLYKIPIEVFTLNLVTLCADGNHLKNIPSQIGLSETLRNVRFNNNNITNLPSEIGNLARLEDIDLRNNAIESLPDSFESLNTLQYVYLHNNPICTNGWIQNSASKKIQDIVTRNKAGCTAQLNVIQLNASMMAVIAMHSRRVSTPYKI
eukprot:g397.t1